MVDVLITGSSGGLGLMSGQLLAEQGHAVTLHARDPARARAAQAALPAAKAVLTGDVSTVAGMTDLAAQANAVGRFGAVIHNVGIGYREPARVETVDGLSLLWAVNVLAPYVLTASMPRPDRLVYLSSGMHLGADPDLGDVQWAQRRWRGSQAYSDSKLHDVWLAFAVARRWPDVASNAVSPGWVATRMGGPGANDVLDEAHRTQVWLAASDDAEAARTGRYLYHREPAPLHTAAADERLQERLLDQCREASGIALDERAPRTGTSGHDRDTTHPMPARASTHPRRPT